MSETVPQVIPPPAPAPAAPPAPIAQQFAEAVPAVAAPPPLPAPVAPPVAAPPAAAPTAPPVVVAPAPAAAPAPPPAPVVAPAAPAAPPASLLSEVPVGPQPVTYQPFVAPEGRPIDPEALAPYAEVLSVNGVPQEQAQRLVDVFLAQQARDAAKQIEAWGQTRGQWRESFVADPELGGANQAKTLDACRQVISRFAGTPEHAAELRTVLDNTGSGDHPALIRLLANVHRAFAEGKPVVTSNAKPPIQISPSRNRYPNSPTMTYNGVA